ncbi:pectin acetylesterase-family hydrolase [Haliea sp. E1-2-M8]|uniref:pectin acetylesterase-family hydrolase n=1 Tax=Haliea sp. E1-2-M8 TaxID=3064706 RepID=UPI00271FC8AC|nr:pectin acetylesterase-family hydrolase [Haliea sp. E1-2-M8]MDO8862926.1 pectin acetylesterase-family hydrolase [Haliea sp. E1-2-M8]
MTRCRAFCALILSSLALTATAADGEWETIAPGGDTLCATGTPFSFQVREADPQKVMIFFNGGGACWSAETCDAAGQPSYRPFASAEAGNDPRHYDGAFALANPENPFRDWSQVFVSYCTGDVHLGAADATYTRADGTDFSIHHRGWANSMAALDYLFAHFTAPERVVVAGGSAGAVSSPVFAAMVARHYPEADVVQFAGGGAGYRLPPPTVLWQSWNVLAALPGWYNAGNQTAETLTIPDLYRLAYRAAPALRFHQFDHAFDAVQEDFHRMLGDPVELLPGLDANRSELQADIPSLRNYVAAGEFHTLLRFSELYSRETAGVRAVDWVRALIAGENVAEVHCGAPEACR